MDEWTRERYPGVTARQLEAERRRKPLRRHVFTPSGQRTYGQRICTCGSVEQASVHQLQERDEHERQTEARRVGER